MSNQRPIHQKIPDIKVVRALTRFLGKLHIPSCYHPYREEAYHYDDNNNLIGKTWIDKESYGWGLKESKDYVEGKYEYFHPTPEAAAQELARNRMGHETKRTRELMRMLKAFGIKSADDSLSACRAYVARRNN